jgi:hypothetical protein
MDGLDKDCLFDAGFGLQFYKMLLGKQKTFRVDYSLWWSQPESDEFSSSAPYWKFRWMVRSQYYLI